MADLALALSDAIVHRIGALSPSVAVRDRAEDAMACPYVELGEVHLVEDGAECVDAVEAYVTLHVWSRSVGTVEAKMLSGTVRAALHLADLDLGPDWRLGEIAWHDTRIFDDPDGVTAHAVLTFRALAGAV